MNAAYELAKRSFTAARSKEVIDDDLPAACIKACQLNPAKMHTILRLITNNPTGDVRHVEACLSLRHMLESTAEIVASSEFFNVKEVA